MHNPYTQPAETGETDPISGQEEFQGLDGEKFLIVSGITKTENLTTFVPSDDGEEELILVPGYNWDSLSTTYFEGDDENASEWNWDAEKKYFYQRKIYESGMGGMVKIITSLFKKFSTTRYFMAIEKATGVLSKIKYKGKKIFHWERIHKKWMLTKFAKSLPAATLNAIILTSLIKNFAGTGIDVVKFIWDHARDILGLQMMGGMVSFIGEEGVQGAGMNVYQAAAHKELPPSALKNAIDIYSTTVEGATALHNLFGWSIARPSFDLFFAASKGSIPTYLKIYDERAKLYGATGPLEKERDAWLYTKMSGRGWLDTFKAPIKCPGITGVSEGMHTIIFESSGFLPKILNHKFKMGEVYEWYEQLEKSHYIKSITSGRRIIIDEGKRIIIDGISIDDPITGQKEGKEVAMKSHLVSLTHGKDLEVKDTGKTEGGIEIAKVFLYEIQEGKIIETNVSEEMNKFLVKYELEHPEEKEGEEIDTSNGVVEIMGKCTEVADGDTVTITVYDPEWEKKNIDPHTVLGKYTIRLDGIDAPEIAHGRGKTADYGGSAVKTLVSWMIEKEYVTIKVYEKDKYNRYVGKVYIGDVCINEVLLRIGAVRCLKEYLREEDKEYIEYEENAKKDRIGIWSFEHGRKNEWAIPTEVYEAKGITPPE